MYMTARICFVYRLRLKMVLMTMETCSLDQERWDCEQCWCILSFYHQLTYSYYTLLLVVKCPPYFTLILLFDNHNHRGFPNIWRTIKDSHFSCRWKLKLQSHSVQWSHGDGKNCWLPADKGEPHFTNISSALTCMTVYPNSSRFSSCNQYKQYCTYPMTKSDT